MTTMSMPAKFSTRDLASRGHFEGETEFSPKLLDSMALLVASEKKQPLEHATRVHEGKLCDTGDMYDQDGRSEPRGEQVP